MIFYDILVKRPKAGFAIQIQHVCLRGFCVYVSNYLYIYLYTHYIYFVYRNMDGFGLWVTPMVTYFYLTDCSFNLLLCVLFLCNRCFNHGNGTGR